MKKQRQKKILEIIEKYEIDTQETLKEYLEKENIIVTQATLSRDINELALVKTIPENGKCRYAVPVKNHYDFPMIFSNSVIEIDYALNTVVVKCHAGMAQAACMTLDKMDYSKIVGTLAGDDTIFILMRTEADAADFADELRDALHKSIQNLGSDRF